MLTARSAHLYLMSSRREVRNPLGVSGSLSSYYFRSFDYAALRLRAAARRLRRLRCLYSRSQHYFCPAYSHLSAFSSRAKLTPPQANLQLVANRYTICIHHCASITKISTTE